ncbi:hypothetical protein BDBG_01928 [Blastomyces gilchristii SLH14081]|uniref:Uncharacterized protein n=1 Tax=Blastomyces gilchristii (strain SLH14081) TaxID=559298 RepID=A0A179UEH3_BLAGS|nr:uncharacterized protein BDBG_01928 [Blastomyces gilchristii SLH14081]OAT05547.1 hypothetical protein BDBG_01928 [Blastomyces gilchristii SLH14081]
MWWDAPHVVMLGNSGTMAFVALRHNPVQILQGPNWNLGIGLAIRPPTSSSSSNYYLLSYRRSKLQLILKATNYRSALNIGPCCQLLGPDLTSFVP